MYKLEVFLPGSHAPDHVIQLRAGAEVLAKIPELLATHAGCERIVVWSGLARLFAVDCQGNRLPA